MTFTNKIPEHIREQLQQLKTARLNQGLTQSQLGAILRAGRTTVQDWEAVRKCPKPEHLQRISIWLEQVEAKPRQIDTLKESTRESTERCEQLKHLLNLLEFHLRYFQNELPEARETYRRELDVYDVGYLTSMLEMLFDESKFQRWKTFTTHRFGGFRRKGSARKGKDKGEPG